VANGNNGDSGDSTIYGNLIQPGAAGSGITWNSSGGLRIENNKILGSGSNQGIQFSLANGVSTSDIFVIGNSIEGLVTGGNAISLARAGTTGGLNNVIISNNELGGGQVCVNVPADANGTWLINLNIQGNACIPTNVTTTFGFIVNSTNGAIVMHNSMYAPNAGTNTPLSMGAGFTTTNCVVGYNPKVGTWAAATAGGCATAAPI
jgi:hypothetical protein